MDIAQLLLEAAETIEALIVKVETDFTEGDGEIPEDVAETLMKDWVLVRRLNEARQRYAERRQRQERGEAP